MCRPISSGRKKEAETQHSIFLREQKLEYLSSYGQDHWVVSEDELLMKKFSFLPTKVSVSMSSVKISKQRRKRGPIT